MPLTTYVKPLPNFSPVIAYLCSDEKNRLLFLLFFLLFFLVAADVFLGSVRLPAADVWQAMLGNSPEGFAYKIVWNFRIPKMLTALMAGMALSVCGVQMQTLFRNPLADPYVLGISSGAGLGVALFVMGTSLFRFLLPYRGWQTWERPLCLDGCAGCDVAGSGCL